MTAGSAKNMEWNTSLYDNKHDFVFKYGEDLVDLLAPKAEENILDLGCGTGYLTNLISTSGATVVGIDNSVEMIDKARQEYPHLDFKVRSATDFDFKNTFDAVFSNAVLHWVLDKEAVINCINSSLKNGGRFVAEFGGKNNVKNIIDALRRVLLRHNYPENATIQPWFYPSIGEYTSLLEKGGLVVNYASYYNRETELKDHESGIKDWILMFGKSFLEGLEKTAVEQVLDEVQETVKQSNFRNNKWYADYKRLRIVATKPL
jgi:trans-aconitate methyltransferase